MSAKHANISIFVPHLGCPNMCSFCNQHHIARTEKISSKSDVDEAVAVAKQSKNYNPSVTEIAFFGGSFTGIPREAQEAYLRAVQPFLERGEAESIRLSTRPDCIDRETVTFLKNWGVKTVELGAQSMSDRVLLAAGRGHTAADTKRASALILEGGLRLGLQMMTGLPASTAADEAETARQFVALGAQDARIYPTVVFRDTALFTRYENGTYSPPTMEETVERAAACLDVLEAGGVQILRIGLQETETLGATVAAGAYHPALGELVHARKWRNRLEDAVRTLGGREITVLCKETLTSRIVGQKRENFSYLTEKYHIKLLLKHTAAGCFVTDGRTTISIGKEEKDD